MRQAREEGHSWSEFGAALNMSKQAAWESYKLSKEPGVVLHGNAEI